MNRKFLGIMTGALFATAVSFGCGGGGGNASNFNYDPPPGPTPPAEKTINFSIPAYGPNDQAVVVVTPTSGDEFDGALSTVQITTSQTVPRVDNRTTTTFDAAKAYDDRADATADACGTHASMVAVEQELQARGAGASPEQIKLREAAPRFDELAAGAEATLFTPTGTGTVTVTKILGNNQTVHCNILAEGTGANTIVDAAAALRLAQIFDSSNPFDQTQPGTIGIYDRLTGLCGTEWRTNPVGGRDGDLRVNIVLLSNGNIGDGVMGIVSFADLLPTSFPGASASNQGEFIYLNAELLAVDNGTDLQNYSFYHALAHEFLHLIQMNTKVSQNGTFPGFDPSAANPFNQIRFLNERRTLAEGFAETAATLCGYGVAHARDFTPAGGAEANSLNAINKFAGGATLDAALDDVTLCGSDFFPSVLETASPNFFGMGHMFGLHIVQRFGPEKWGELTKSPYVGMLNLTSVLQVQAENIFHSFNIALHVSTLINAPQQYQFPFLTLDNVNAMRTFRSGAAPQLVLLPAFPFQVTLDPGDDVEGQNLPPWSCQLVRYTGGNGSTFNLEINLPIKSRAAVVHESPVGTFSSVNGL